jgi:hypothetical protein
MEEIPAVRARKLVQSLRRMMPMLAPGAAAAGIPSKFHLFFSAFE